MGTELEYLDKLEKWLSVAFEEAAEARDKAQNTLEQIRTLKTRLIERRIEILRAVEQEERQ